MVKYLSVSGSIKEVMQQPAYGPCSVIISWYDTGPCHMGTPVVYSYPVHSEETGRSLILQSDKIAGVIVLLSSMVTDRFLLLLHFVITVTQKIIT